MLNKLFNALSKTRSKFVDTFSRLLGKGIDLDALENLEEQLLETDMGFETVEHVLESIKKNRTGEIKANVRYYLLSILPEKNKLEDHSGPMVIMIVGVNGTGKTTSSAKLANIYKESGKSVTLVAADTYRAAAVQQLRVWSERLDCKLICNENTSEPSAVLFDGLESARANNTDIVIVDTAGRLHTSENLMSELSKMYRLINNRFSDFKVNTLITLDANLGQNSLAQAKEFNKHCNLNGAILSKLDGTARGGIVFPLYKELKIPVQFIGFGETLTDLELFDPVSYVNSLFGLDDKSK